MTHDVRGIANWVLDRAEQQGRSLTNLAINKIIFFLYSHYLVQFGHPLVSAKIEAWEYGPVFREVYHCFKHLKENPINTRATRINPSTGGLEICEASLSEMEETFLKKVAPEYIRMSASNLVALSHQKGAPWDLVWNHERRVNSSMKITDDLVRNWYEKSLRH
jgi:uncharacterized phage-associated protein